MKKPVKFETAFGVYVVDEVIGAGGAGRVFGGVGPEGDPIAVKLLAHDSPSEKRRRFKNEINFLMRNAHPNIVTVLDYGVATGRPYAGPFYVMRRYDCSLRDLMRGGIAVDDVMRLFSQVLDGVEAAHLLRVIHRDLKPENILYDRSSKRVAIADFGIARFTEDVLATFVETAPGQRLANFLYAAPEQRERNGTIGAPADLYSLGLMLNELFTGKVPHGTEYATISTVSERWGFLDNLVASLLRQVPAERPGSIGELKALIRRHEAEAVSSQRLSKHLGAVVPADAVDEPLAHEPPRLIGVDWQKGELVLSLDREVTKEWVSALHNMERHRAVYGKGPQRFRFEGTEARIGASEHDAADIVRCFKEWLPVASRVLKGKLEHAAHQREMRQRAEIERARKEEERRLRILRNVSI